MIHRDSVKKQFLIFLLSSIFFAANAYAACDVEFEWTANPESYVEGYKIHYGNNQGGPYDNVFDAGKPVAVDGKIKATIPQLPTGTWYFVATAYDSEYESEYSAEVNFVCQSGSSSNQAPTLISITAVPNPADNPRRNITFTVSASDSDGDPLSYKINFGDGTSSSSGSTVTHAYNTKGTYNVTATVSDNHGHSVSKTLQVVVNDNKPVKVTGVKAK